MKKFVRTRPAAPPATSAPLTRPAHGTNGHLNGVGNGPRRDDQHSTLSRQCGGEEAGALWEDPEFPADARAIGDRRLAANVHWLRPHDLSARPRFLGDTTLEEKLNNATSPHGPGVSSSPEPEPEPDDQFAARWSVEVGELGDTNLCCAAAALALTPRLLERVAPPHSFRRGYTGAFRFQLWVFGSWREVVVDDRLPARGARLLASRAALPHDYTLPLLEKAYAKLYGSYAALRGGSCARALQDLSGGVVQSFAPPCQPPALLFRVLNSAVPRSTLIVATAQPEKESGGRRLRNGLVAEQAYCVTGLARVRDATGEESGGAGAGALVRLRAPSGRGEWRGAWARGGAQWRALPPADRELLAARTPEPAHFWMPFGEFARAFWRLELVHVGPDEWVREPALRGRRPWRAVVARRRWRAGYNAGGPPPGRTAAANPQFRVAVPPPGAAHLVLAVAQHYEPAAARRPRGLGFALYELPPAAAARRAALAAHEDAFKDYRALEAAHAGRAREVAAFVLLAPGHYLLVPHARRAHAEGAFLLRVLCDRRADVWEVNDDNVIIRDINTEFQDDGRSIPPHVQSAITKIIKKQGSDEVDAWALRAVLRRAGRWCLAARPSLELCRALLVLRDARVAGCLPAAELPPLLRLLALWRLAIDRHLRCGARVSSYRLRALLWAAGVSASNKVLECLVLRFARRATLSAEACVMALARLHLAHERYRSLDAKLKSNPLSLEEVILMTIYS